MITRTVPDDPALPMLRELFLDSVPSFVAKATREQLGIRGDLDNVTTIYTNYRPSTRCTIAWSLPMWPERPLIMSGTLFSDDEGERMVHRADFQRQAASAQEVLDGRIKPFVYLRGQRLLLQVVPLDAGLTGLLAASKEDFARQALRIGFGGAAPDMDVEMRLDSYKPGQRCVYEYSVPDGKESVRLFAKVLADEMPAETIAWLRAAASRINCAPGAWSIVPPIAHIPDANTLLFESVEGGVQPTRLLRRSRYDQRAKETLLQVIRNAAQGLGAIQGLSPDGLQAFDAADLLASLTSDIDSVRSVAPGLWLALEAGLQELEVRLHKLQPEPTVPCHGSYRFSQMLAVGTDLSVLDMDSVCSGGASADAANFLAYLDKMALRRPKLATLIGECQTVFEQAAIESSAASPEWLAWQRAASDLKIAVRSFFTLSPRWPSISRKMLQLAHEQLASTTATGALA